MESKFASFLNSQVKNEQSRKRRCVGAIEKHRAELLKLQKLENSIPDTEKEIDECNVNLEWLHKTATK